MVLNKQISRQKVVRDPGKSSGDVDELGGICMGDTFPPSLFGIVAAFCLYQFPCLLCQVWDGGGQGLGER